MRTLRMWEPAVDHCSLPRARLPKASTRRVSASTNATARSWLCPSSPTVNGWFHIAMVWLLMAVVWTDHWSSFRRTYISHLESASNPLADRTFTSSSGPPYSTSCPVWAGVVDRLDCIMGLGGPACSLTRGRGLAGAAAGLVDAKRMRKTFCCPERVRSCDRGRFGARPAHGTTSLPRRQPLAASTSETCRPSNGPPVMSKLNFSSYGATGPSPGCVCCT
mmetsp:Transcript_39125/g.70167  ORF Transcript_39125/g.70167 Transcript_39125/m.70167 type:complete len:220 (+) Transcript_39125:493-1152(+)